MALGKKKQDDQAAATEPDLAEADPFEVATPEEAPATSPLDALAAPEEPAGDPLAGGADALLNMFQTTQAEEEDRSLVLDLAGDVELSDLLEDLHTVAVALGVALRVA